MSKANEIPKERIRRKSKPDDKKVVGLSDNNRIIHGRLVFKMRISRFLYPDIFVRLRA